jgi:hypothetical protein
MLAEDEQDGRGFKDGIGIEEEVLVLDDMMERMVRDERIKIMIYRWEMGMVKVDERMERWCRVNKVVDEGMERMVEKDGPVLNIWPCSHQSYVIEEEGIRDKPSLLPTVRPQ